MAIIVEVTHIWSKLFTPITWLSRILFAVIILSIFTLFIPQPGFWQILYGIGFLGLAYVHILYIDPIYHTIQTYLYVNINLKTKITFSEAKEYYFFLHRLYSEDGIQ